MSELPPDLVRRLLWATRFDGTEHIWWRQGEGDTRDELHVYARCSDFFAWGCADLEPIETEADVELFEQARADLVHAEGADYPMWTGELYAARRRGLPPDPMMLAGGRYAMSAQVEALFPVGTPDGGDR